MSEHVVFPSSTGPNLAGRIEVPEGAVRGWGCSRTASRSVRTAGRQPDLQAAGRRGIGMLRFDNPRDSATPRATGATVRSPQGRRHRPGCEFMNDRATPPRLWSGTLRRCGRDRRGPDSPTASVGGQRRRRRYEPGHVEHNYDALVERLDVRRRAPFLVGGQGADPEAAFIEDVRAADLREQIARCAGRC